MNKNLVFGTAIEAAKDGKLIRRSGWNGKGMFVFQRPADNLPIDMVVEKVKSLPQAVKNFFANEPHCNEDVVHFTAYLCLKAADGTIVNGWLASQSDMLAEDWEILD